MIRYFLLLVCIGSFCKVSFSQAIPDKFIPKNKSQKSTSKPVVPASKPVVKETQKPVAKREQNNPPESKSENSTQPIRVSPSGLESVFSTSEDCVLEIDGRWIGTLLKNEPKTIALDFGRHKLVAQNKSTREVYTTTITVLRNNQEVNIAFRESAPEFDLEASTVAMAQPSATDVIRVDKNEISEPVPYYVNRSSILQTVRELSSTMVALSGGRFEKTKIGSGKKSEDSVTISPFLLGRYEVTQQQWQQVMGYNNSDNKDCNDCPIENISWNEVAEFLRTINENSEVKFRLPTDAEWEFAARLDTRDYIDKRGGRRYGDNVAWNENNAQRKPHSVGTRIPHRSGAYDLMGNVA
jgi:formylglycine-generating enzyme required for sulfatase activity